MCKPNITEQLVDRSINHGLIEYLFFNKCENVYENLLLKAPRKSNTVNAKLNEN